MVEQSVQRENRQRKIVDPEALVCNLHGDGVVLMDLRQNLRLFLLHNALDLVEQIPDLRLYKETVGILFLDGIGKRIQTDHRCAVTAHALQCPANEFLDSRLFHIQIDLFLAERAPDLFRGAVGELCLDVGSTGLSLIDQIQLLRCGLAVFPKGGIADKEVTIRRLVLVL